MNEEKPPATVALTVLELTLIALVVMVALTTAGFGVGFYLGTKTTMSTQVTDICLAMERAYHGQLNAVQTEKEELRLKLDRYEQFLSKTVGGGAK